MRETLMTAAKAGYVTKSTIESFKNILPDYESDVIKKQEAEMRCAIKHCNKQKIENPLMYILSTKERDFVHI
jgi:hypothetical protein